MADLVSDTFADTYNLMVIVVTLLVVYLCVALHYEVLNGCSRFVSYLEHRRRRRMVALIFIILTTHVAEIWLFAIGYFFLLGFDFGSLNGIAPMSLPDYAYYSAMVYTTVGFGDIVPVGPIRLMTGMEGLTGLVMITWSASFTFLYMQRHWRSDSDQ